MRIIKKIFTAWIIAAMLLTQMQVVFAANPAPSEQYTGLTVGETYYFNLRNLGIPGTVNPALPDTTLQWVPFTYVGTVDAYSLDKSASGNSSASDSATATPRSLFVSNYVLTTGISWDELNYYNYIFGKEFTSNFITVKLRAMSVGNLAEMVSGKQKVSPESNEWSRILEKGSYIQNCGSIFSLGQDTYKTEQSTAGRMIRGVDASNPALASAALASDVSSVLGYRPVLEITSVAGNQTVLSSCTLDMDGKGTFGTNNTLTSVKVVHNGRMVLPAISDTTGVHYTDATSTGLPGWYLGDTRYEGSSSVDLAPDTTLKARRFRQATISGPTELTLTENYNATANSGAFTLTGDPPITVSIVQDIGGTNITWDSANKRLNIPIGVPVGTYPITLRASNSGSSAEHIFTLKVVKAPAAPAISGASGKTLGAGYENVYTVPYTVTGSPAPTVNISSPSSKITWDNTNQQLKIDTGIAEGTYPVTLTASNGRSPDAQFTFTLKVVPKDMIIRIDIKHPPTKKNYNIGEKLNLSGLVVTVYRVESYADEVPAADFASKGLTVSPADGTILDGTVSVITVTDTNSGVSAKQNINVNYPQVSSVTVKTPPARTEYVAGKPLDLTGLVVILHWNNDTTEEVPLVDFAYKGITVSPADGTTLTESNTKATITYAAQFLGTPYTRTVDQPITVNPVVVSSVTVKTPPTKTSYQVNDSLDLTGLAVTLKRNDGTTEDVNFSDFGTKGLTVSPDNGTTLANGHTKVTITHTASGISAEQPITVTDSDVVAVEAAKTAAENAAYGTLTQASAPTEMSVRSAVRAIAETAINNTEVDVTVSKISYTAPVAGDSANPSGTNGSYTFTVKVTKNAATRTVGQKTVTITATALATVDSVTVKTAPAKTTYTAGEALDLTGLVVTLHKSGNSTEDVNLSGFGTKGLTVSPADGTTLATSHDKVTITHTASGKSVDQTITVNAAPVAPTITTTSLPNGTVNTAYIQTLAASGDMPITWSKESGNLPGGLTLNTSTGELSGTPTATGTFTFTVKATNVAGSATKELSIAVVPGPDFDAVNAAWEKAQYATYHDMTQAEATSETVIADALRTIAVTVVNDGTVAVSITKRSYTAPTAGDADNPSGTDGSYTFVVHMTRGIWNRDTYPDKTIAITATPFAGLSNVQAVAAAKAAIVGGNVNVANGATQADKTAAVQSYVNGLLSAIPNAAGVAATVTYNTGSQYNVVLSKGSASDSKTLAMMVNEAAPVTVNSVTVKTAPTKTTYTAGEPLDLTGLMVTLNKSDSSTEDVGFTDFGTNGITVSPANGTTLTASDIKVTITHTASGKSVDQTIIVNAAPVTVNSVSIKTAPTKTTYTAGDILDLTGLVVTLNKSDSSTEDVGFTDFGTNGITVSPANGTALTTSHTKVTITHTASGKSAEQTITVNAAPVTVNSVTVKTAPTKTTYTAGEPLDLTGLVVTLNKSDSSTEDVVFADFAVKGITTNPTSGTTLSVSDTSVIITYTSDSKTVSQAIMVNPAPVVDVDAIISPTGISYDLSAPADVVTTITWNSASTVTDVVYGTTSLTTPEVYAVTGSALTIKSSYINALGTSEGDEVIFTIFFDKGDSSTLTVNIVDSYIPSSNAKLRDLTVNGSQVSGFDPDTTIYNVELPYGTASVSVGAIPDDAHAAVAITQAQALPGDATVVVIAEDKTTTKSYTIHFTLGSVPIVHSVTVQSDGNGAVSSNVYSASKNTEIILSATPNSGYRFKAWQVVDGSVTITDNKFIMPDNNVTVKAIFDQIPVTSYQVTVNGSYAAASGAGSYAEGITVTINAGSRSNYTFSGWTSTGGVTFANASSATTTFTMLAGNVTVTASWSYSGGSGGNSGGGSSGGTGGGSSSGNGTSTSVNTQTPRSSTITIDTKTDSSGKAATMSVTESQITGAVNQAIEEAKNGQGTAAVEIKVNATGDVETVETNILKTAVQALADSNADTLTVSTPVAKITFDSKSIDTISGEAVGDVKITAAKVDSETLSTEIKQAVGDRPVFDFSVVSGNKTISRFGGSVTVLVPYTPQPGEDKNAIVIYYINAEGKPEIVSNCVYDPETGMISFTTNHFSKYAVGYNKLKFNDVSKDASYSQAVSFVAARGIAGGTGEGKFSPGKGLTRAQFLVMMMKAYGITPDKNPADNFTDAGSTFYTNYLATAKRLGITEGTGGNKFSPNKALTRQEMVALLYSFLKAIGKLPQGDSGVALSSFSDAGSTASWAKEAMTLMVETGIVGGNNGKLSPNSTATRADMAQILYNLLSK